MADEPPEHGSSSPRDSGRHSTGRRDVSGHSAHRQAAASGHGHGHGHGHGPAAPASRPVKQLLALALAPFAAAALVGILLLYPFGHDQQTGADLGFGQEPVKGEVVTSTIGACSEGAPPPAPGEPSCAVLDILMEDGPASGETIRQTVPREPATPAFAAGDRVVLAYSGTDPALETSFQVVDFQRGGSLLVVALVFAGAVLVLGRWKGLSALVALGLSLAVIIGFVLPAILAGRDPLTVAIVGSGVIMFTVLYLTHGFSARTSTAVLGTLISLALIGALSAVFSATTSLTGLDENTASLIGVLGTAIDVRGLLLAGIVIGALGVLDDVTVTQTSAVWELRRADPSMSWQQLYAAGVRIGRDHVASAVNTLVLAYAGTALPLLLAYTLSGRTFAEIVSSQSVAQEVVRTLVGSIGLVAAVPITTAIAALVAVREPGTTAPGTGPADRVARAATTSAATATHWRPTTRHRHGR